MHDYQPGPLGRARREVGKATPLPGVANDLAVLVEPGEHFSLERRNIIHVGAARHHSLEPVAKRAHTVPMSSGTWLT